MKRDGRKERRKKKENSGECMFLRTEYITHVYYTNVCTRMHLCAMLNVRA